MHRPGLIWNRDERKENRRTKEYLYLAYQKAVEMAARENITSLEDFDKNTVFIIGMRNGLTDF